MAKFGSGVATILVATALSSGVQAEENQSGFSDVINAGGPAVEKVLSDTQTATSGLIRDTGTILLAQAQETDGKVYVAEVIQVDGTKKTVKYYKDKQGAIIPPEVVNGKLIDGSDAPPHPLRAKNAQVKILVKYDKDTHLTLALASKQDILGDADKTLKEIISLSENGKLVTKEQLYNGFYSAYLFNIALGNGKGERSISGLEAIGKIKLKMSDGDITKMKQDSKLKALEIWKSITGAMAVG